CIAILHRNHPILKEIWQLGGFRPMRSSIIAAPEGDGGCDFWASLANNSKEHRTRGGRHHIAERVRRQGQTLIYHLPGTTAIVAGHESGGSRRVRAREVAWNRGHKRRIQACPLCQECVDVVCRSVAE